MTGMAMLLVRTAGTYRRRLLTAAVLCALSSLVVKAQGKPRAPSPAPAPASSAPKPKSTAAAPGSKAPVPTAPLPPATAPALAEQVEVMELAVLSANVSGVVEDSVGHPIVGAEIYVTNLPHQTRTGAGGTFRLPGLPSGPVMITARRIGYHPTTVTVHLVPGRDHDLDLTLAEVQARTFELIAVRIVATPAPMRSVFQAGFFMRKASYPAGTFFDREYIVAMNPMYLSDVFRTTNGMQSVRDRRGQSQWITRLNSTTNCPVRFFIDGNNVPMNGMSIDDLVRPNEVEGIEIYRGVSTVPAEFSGKSLQDDSRCGVVAIWTRVTR